MLVTSETTKRWDIFFGLVVFNPSWWIEGLWSKAHGEVYGVGAGRGLLTAQRAPRPRLELSP